MKIGDRKISNGLSPYRHKFGGSMPPLLDRPSAENIAGKTKIMPWFDESNKHQEITPMPKVYEIAPTALCNEIYSDTLVFFRYL